MNDCAKRLKEKLDVVTLARDDFDALIKDRLDFGFDSIYLRYAEAIDELAIYKAMVDNEDPVRVYRRLYDRKQHFYEALEQLLHAHREA